MIFLKIDCVGFNSTKLPKQWQLLSFLKMAAYTKNSVKPAIISIVSHQICLNQILRIKKSPIDNSMNINSLDKNVVVPNPKIPKL